MLTSQILQMTGQGASLFPWSTKPERWWVFFFSSLTIFPEGEYKLPACARIPRYYPNSKIKGVFCPHPTFLGTQALPLCKVY